MPLLVSYLKNNKILSGFLFVICSIYLSFNVIYKSKVNIVGDGLEYVLMTEALYNHATPNVIPSDIQKYESEVSKYFISDLQPKKINYSGILNYLNDVENRNPLERVDGFALSKNRKLYSIHFFTYSLAVLPIKFIAKPFNIHPVRVMYIANVIFMLLVIYLILYNSPLKEWENIVIAFLFFYSTVQFYLIWTHPEVFVACLIFLGVFYYFIKKRYLGIFLCSIAVTQYQPMGIFVLGMVVFSLFEDKFRIKSFIKLGLVSFWVIIPPLFYYINYGHFNLIKEFGFLDTKFITPTRVIGFFTDANQGLILNFPLILVSYIALIILSYYKKVKNKKLSITVFDFIPLILIVTVAIVSTMGNWSHGQAVTNRYVAYIGTFLLIHFIILFTQFNYLKWVKVLLVLIVISQIYTINFYGGIFSDNWDGDKHKPTATYLLDNYPELYNPDPHIFYQRTIPYQSENFYYQGVTYLDNDNNFKKAIVNVDHLDEVNIGGLTKDQLNLLIEGKKQQYGWVYFHESDLIDKIGESSTKDFLENLKNKAN